MTGFDDPKDERAGVVLVEFPSTPGVQEVARSPAELIKKSGEALDSASEVIREMARRFSAQAADLPIKPREMELEFGVKLTAEAGAFVAKVGGEGALTVRMKWAPADM